jgi:hypothetical protein
MSKLDFLAEELQNLHDQGLFNNIRALRVLRALGLLLTARKC